MGKDTKLVTKTFKVKVTANEGERTILAVVSSENLDRDYERVDVKSLRLPLKSGGHVVAKDLLGTEKLDIPLLINHSFDVEDIIGSVRKAYVSDSNELVVEFGISGRAKAQELMTLIDEDHLGNAFSITMNDYEYIDNTFYGAEVVEISLVFRGSNKDARILSVKSLIKGETMDETINPAENEVETPIVETPEVETPVVEEEVVDTPEEVKEEAPAEPETPEVIEKLTNIEEKTMEKSIAQKQVVEAVDQPVEAKVTMSKDAQREMFVKQFSAYRNGDRKNLSDLNKKAMEVDGVSKAIGFDDATSIYKTEVVSADILEEYTNVGRIGSLVSRIDISGAETWKQIIQTAGNGFQPVGTEEAKAEDKPVWTHLSIEPKEHAMIVAWYDGMAKRTPLAVYNTIIRYIAKEYAKLEDKIIVSFAGATTLGGDTFAATGLEPILRTASRTVELASYDADKIALAIGEAFGKIESDDNLTMVANRKTWGALATATDTLGRAVFTAVGNQVTAGALGTFNIVISQEVSDDSVIFGAFGDYQLVTNGGLATLFSQEATVGELNLYQSDASALRANCDIAGKPVKTTSFVVIDHVSVS